MARGELAEGCLLESLEYRMLLSISFNLNPMQPLTPSTDINVSALAWDETSGTPFCVRRQDYRTTDGCGNERAAIYSLAVGRVVGPDAGGGAPGEFCRTVMRISVSTARWSWVSMGWVAGLVALVVGLVEVLLNFSRLRRSSATFLSVASSMGTEICGSTRGGRWGDSNRPR